jgi:transposase-like protein
MARRGYPPEFRQRVVALVEGGRKVSEVAAELEVSEQTIYTWRRQARIDAGLEVGVTTAEHAKLQAVERRIRELETELAIHRRATELLKEKHDPQDVRGGRSDRRRGTPGRSRMSRSRCLGLRLLHLA